MAKRHRDAIGIQGGACNPIAILNSIENAILELKQEVSKEQDILRVQCIHLPTDTVTGDPAIRLMVHQLAHICNVLDMRNWSECMDLCEGEE